MKIVRAPRLKIYRPLFVILALAAFFVVARLVLAQNATPAAVPPSDLKSFTEIVGLITQILILTGLAVAIVYFFWRGKSNEQLKEQVAGWKDTAERRAQRNAELETEKTRDKAEIERLRLLRKEDRKRILRLTGQRAGEDLDDFLAEAEGDGK